MTSQPNRRSFDRVRLDLPARYLCRGEEFQGAVLLDVSAAGAALSTSSRPSMGEEIIVYAEAGIRLVGHVIRYFARGFAIAFRPNVERIERLLRRLGLDAATRPGPEGARRAAEAPAPVDAPRCRYQDGTPIEGSVTAVSVVGVTIVSRARPPLGTALRIGRAAGTVTRHASDGFIVEFDAYWATSARNAWLSPDRLKGG